MYKTKRISPCLMILELQRRKSFVKEIQHGDDDVTRIPPIQEVQEQML